MSKPALLEEKEMSLSEVKEQIDTIKKRDGELNFRGQKLEEYLSSFHMLKAADAKKLRDSIVKLDVPRLKDAHIAKIIDILPTNVEMLKTVFQGQPVTISSDNMKKIVSTVSEFTSKKK